MKPAILLIGKGLLSISITLATYNPLSAQDLVSGGVTLMGAEASPGRYYSATGSGLWNPCFYYRCPYIPDMDVTADLIHSGNENDPARLTIENIAVWGILQSSSRKAVISFDKRRSSVLGGGRAFHEWRQPRGYDEDDESDSSVAGVAGSSGDDGDDEDDDEGKKKKLRKKDDLLRIENLTEWICDAISKAGGQASTKAIHKHINRCLKQYGCDQLSPSEKKLVRNRLRSKNSPFLRMSIAEDGSVFWGADSSRGKRVKLDKP